MGSLDVLEEAGMVSNVNVAELYQQEMSVSECGSLAQHCTVVKVYSAFLLTLLYMTRGKPN